MRVQKIFLTVAWIILITLIGVNAWLININVLGAQTSRPSDSNQQRETRDAQYRYWRMVIEDHPDYRDGFVRLAMLAYQLGERNKSREYIEKIRALDPNFEGLRELEALLQTHE